MNGQRCVCGAGPARISQTYSPGLTPIQQAQVSTFENQEYITPYPYYSKVKLRATRTGGAGGPYTWLIAAGTIARAFSYGIGEAMTPAGFLAADGNATIADTNLTRRATTTSAEVVQIRGIAIQPLPAALDADGLSAAAPTVRPLDQQFLAALGESVSVELALNGDQNRFKLGLLSMIPGAGGLDGGAPAMSGRPALAGGVQSELYPKNGWAVRNNFFRLPEGLTWNKQGEADSQLELIFTVQRAVQIFSGGSPETPLGAVVAGAGVQAYDYPTNLVAEFLVHLASATTSPRSRAA
jgi:hypothetical protein